MLRDKLKQLMKKPSEKGGVTNKKKIENLVFFVVLLIVTIVIINLIWNGKKEVTKPEDNTLTTKQLANSNQEVTKVDKQMTMVRRFFSGTIRRNFIENTRSR